MYDEIFESIRQDYEDGKLTFEEAEDLNNAAYEKYALMTEESSYEDIDDTAAVITGAVVAGIAVFGAAIAIARDKKYRDAIKYYESKHPDLVPFNKLHITNYTSKGEECKGIFKKLKKVYVNDKSSIAVKKFTTPEGKEVFTVVRTWEGTTLTYDATITNYKYYLKFAPGVEKYEDYYSLFLFGKSNSKHWKFANDLVDEYKKAKKDEKEVKNTDSNKNENVLTANTMLNIYKAFNEGVIDEEEKETLIGILNE